MCKQEFWVSQSGATMRFDPSHVPAASGKMRWLVAASAAIGICVMVAIGMIAYYLGRQPSVEPAPRTAAIQNPQFAPAPPPGAAPSVQSRSAREYPAAAQAKPSSRRPEEPEPRAIAKASPAAPVAVAKYYRPAPLPTPADLHGRPLDKATLLSATPEVDLDPDYMKWTRKKIAAKAEEIVAENRTEKDAFVKLLIKERRDLAGLPFILGKDCELDSKETASLARYSEIIREALADVEERPRPRGKSSSSGSGHVTATADAAAAEQFWSSWNRSGARSPLQSTSISAFHQILTGEGRGFRLGLVAQFSESKDVRATQSLVNRALFDLDDDVRQAAVAALGNHPAKSYVPALKKALRYPWHPVVENAVHAIATLERRELIGDLIDLLDAPDPRAAFPVKGEDGKERIMVRELVRINHHRNCMLCHPPLVPKERDSHHLPMGPAPNPEDRLPSPSSAYSMRAGDTVVRADITYLRQDFSLSQAVKDPGKWPEMQRFDFLVRTRELTPIEIARQPKRLHIEYRQCIAHALRSLTRLDAPPDAQAWREVLKLPGTAKAPPNR